MTELQNTLKEIDLQIIYRRLEARKKNITRDGQMSKRQIATAYRGYHGLENQYHALTRMSNQTSMHAKLKNDHLHIRHVDDMKYLIEQEKHTRERSEHNLKVMRDDFTAQLAYQYVYKTHSFKRYYKSQQQKKPRPASDKPEMYDQERNASAKSNTPRPLGSLRELELYKDELKFKFPPIQHKSQTQDSKSPKVNVMEGKTYDTLKEETKDHGSTMTSFPNIEEAMGIRVKVNHTSHDDDRHSAITAPPAGLNAEADDSSSSGMNANLVPLDMGQTLMQMRKKEQERHEQRRQLPVTPNTKKREERKESWKRIMPETPRRHSPVYPDDNKLKKLMKREVTDVMDLWARHSKRLDVVALAKDHHKSTLAENPFPTFDRSRPTSAILGEFKEYKKMQTEQEADRQKAEHSQAMIVRQMSPQPRVGSPVAHSRNEFMNASRAVLQRENSNISVANQGRLRRTDSERFPSVSRTSSYKDVLDNTVGLHEHALLTAAERIELEKQKRGVVKNDRTTKESKQQIQVTPKKTRRKLPAPPTDKKTDTTGQAPMHKTTVFTLDNEVTTTSNVKLANITHNDELTDKVSEVQSIKTEDNPYIPSGRKTTYIDSFVQLPVDSAKRIKDAGALYGKEFWPRLNKTINFNYENFSRTTPETKRRLELRAKNRSKIRQKNAQLKEEMKSKKKSKCSEASSNSDRPPTRVSFNENVIVFQKI